MSRLVFNGMNIKHLLFGPEISIFHEFHKPPYGGGNQFLIALITEFKHRGLNVGTNTVGKNTKAVLFNSYNFDFNKLQKINKRFSPKMIHRIAGPMGTYRGVDNGVDMKIWEINKNLADATIFQSKYSLNAHIKLGLEFKNPTIIPNSADNNIFNKQDRIQKPNGDRKIRLIATAWSDNPKKGGPILSWLDKRLDYSKYDLTFVGRTKAEFKSAKLIDPVPSEELAKILKQHDIYIAPSEDDPCSNALIEALNCGLPALFLKSGGHPEIVKDGGVGFTGTEDLINKLEEISNNYTFYQDKINMPTIEETAELYLRVFDMYEKNK